MLARRLATGPWRRPGPFLTRPTRRPFTGDRGGARANPRRGWLHVSPKVATPAGSPGCRAFPLSRWGRHNVNFERAGGCNQE